MSRELARSTAGSAADDDASSDEELPGHSNMWCPLLEAAYHHSIGAMLALSMCYSSKAALSQSCHFAVFVNPVARSSTDEFFTLCDAHPIMLIEERCEWPNVCNRIVFIAKAARDVRPIGLLFAIVRVQCKLRRIEAKLWEATNFLWATRARGVERCVWE